MGATGVTSLAASANHSFGTTAVTSYPADLRIRATTAGQVPTLQIAAGNTFATDRSVILTSNTAGGANIDTMSGAALTMRTQTQGAFTLIKTGSGTLNLNPGSAPFGVAGAPLGSTVNAHNVLTIGGLAQNNFTLNSVINGRGVGGGVLATQNVTGNPLVANQGTVNVHGGTLLLNAASAQTINLGSTSTFNYGGGAYVQINPATTPVALTGVTTTAATALVTVASTANLVVGMPIVGAGFPAGVTVAAINSGTTFTLNTGTGVTVVTGSTASGGLGTGISTLQAQTFSRLANSNGTLVVTSSNTGLLGNAVALAGVATTVGSTSVSATSVASLAPGMAVFGQGFPSGVTVTSVNYTANTFTISANADAAVTAGAANAAGAVVSLAGGVTTASSPTVTVTSVAGLSPGMTISGAGIPGGTTISAINYGTNTLTLSQSAFAAGTSLALTAGNQARFTVGGTAPTVANGQLTIPSVVILQSGSGNADFASYAGAATGSLQLNTSTRVTSLATDPLATVLADISADANIGTASTADTFNVLSLRTSSNINGTDATDVLQINNGGLILNGTATPPVIGGITPFTLRFGTTATALTEAFVFVRGGQTGNSVITAGIQAADFTKFGAGNLLINGTGNQMNPASNAALRNLVVNEGTLAFAGASSLPTTSLVGLPSGVSAVNLVVNDSGTFNLNGQGLSFAGLGNNNVNTGNTATGTVTNAGANATLTIAGHNQTNNFAGTIADGAGTIALVKRGTGVLLLSGNSNYSGGTTIHAGTLVSSAVLSAQTGATAFANMATGAIGSAEYHGLGTGPITLSGGTLQISSPRTNEHEDIDGLANAFTFGNVASGGYDITVSALNTFGLSNQTSKIHWTNAGVWAAVNSLTVSAPAISFDGSTDNGFFVRGATTLAGDTLLAVNRPVGFGGKLSGTGSSVVTKVGAGLLYLTNSDAGAGANSGIARWDILRDTGAWRSVWATARSRIRSSMAVRSSSPVRAFSTSVTKAITSRAISGSPRSSRTTFNLAAWLERRKPASCPPATSIRSTSTDGVPMPPRRTRPSGSGTSPSAARCRRPSPISTVATITRSG